MTLENVVDNLRDGYSQLEKGSLRQVDHLHEERQENTALRNQWFYTAEGQGFFLREDGGVDWAITPEDENLVLCHIDDKKNSSYYQLVQKRNFVPDNEEAKKAKEAEDTVVANMNNLTLIGDNKQYRFISIRTTDGFVKTESGEYQNPTDDDSKAIVRLGYIPRTLNMLNERGISETRIYVLNPEYVTGELEGSDDNSLWRASLLDDFGYGSGFDACVRRVDLRSALRGVRRVIAAGDAPENKVPSAPQEIERVRSPTMEEILACLGDDVALSVKPKVEDRIRELYNQINRKE